jgi:hypothetical protein
MINAYERTEELMREVRVMQQEQVGLNDEIFMNEAIRCYLIDVCKGIFVYKR